MMKENKSDWLQFPYFRFLFPKSYKGPFIKKKPLFGHPFFSPRATKRLKSHVASVYCLDSTDYSAFLSFQKFLLDGTDVDA